MGITIFKMFVWGGILLDIPSKSRIRDWLPSQRKTKFTNVCLMIYLPK